MTGTRPPEVEVLASTADIVAVVITTGMKFSQ
jgi:hypothetical protein